MSDTVWIPRIPALPDERQHQAEHTLRARLDASTTDPTPALALTGSCGSWMTRPAECLPWAA